MLHVADDAVLLTEVDPGGEVSVTDLPETPMMDLVRITLTGAEKPWFYPTYTVFMSPIERLACVRLSRQDERRR